MPLQPTPVQAPHRIYWIVAGIALALGSAMFLGGNYLVSHSISRPAGLSLVVMGGIGAGIGVRMLASCLNGLRKSKRPTP